MVSVLLLTVDLLVSLHLVDAGHVLILGGVGSVDNMVLLHFHADDLIVVVVIVVHLLLLGSRLLAARSTRRLLGRGRRLFLCGRRAQVDVIVVIVFCSATKLSACARWQAIGEREDKREHEDGKGRVTKTYQSWLCACEG